MKKLLNYIGGEFVQPVSGQFLESDNPALGQPHVLVADSDQRDINAAVEAAKQAFPKWSAKTARERADVLYRIADGIDRRLQELAEAESQDQGKPVWLAKEMDIPRAAYNFRFFAGAILHSSEQSAQMDVDTFNYVVHEPLGVAGLISPWNLPLYLLTWKIAPAIAFGNTCVAKPSEVTSLTANILGEILTEAAVPQGVVNIVFGLGSKAGAALVSHPDVPLISFTGGTQTGRAIAQAVAPDFKKISLELGGKNPNIIFDDADLDQAIKMTLRSSFLNQGEICLCGSRIYVQEGIYNQFLEKFTAKTKELRTGDPSDKRNFIGPVVSRVHYEKVLGYLEIARNEGLKIVTGGTKPKELVAQFQNGFFLEPTIITGVKHSSRLQQEEIFGPVVTVTPFKTDEEALEMANGVTYGLSASVWTTNLKRAHGFSRKIHAGTVWVNTWMNRDLRMPFGGVKASGLGREGQNDSRDFFTEAKTICVRHT